MLLCFDVGFNLLDEVALSYPSENK